jgi:hypothetical protein
MKTLPLAILLITLAPAAAAADGLTRVSLRLDAGTILALHGGYSDSERLKDMVLAGAGMGFAIGYRVAPFFSLEAGYSYNWMFIQKDKRPSAYAADKPALILPIYTLEGTVFLASGGSVRPCLILGAGLCPWRFSSEAIRGEIWAAPENSAAQFSKSSLILGAGLGVEVTLWSRLRLFGKAQYHYLLAADQEKFGTAAFGNQGFLGIRLGLAYSLGSPKPETESEESP